MRRLAGARWPDDRDRPAGRHFEAHAFQDWARRLVGKGHVLEADCTRAHHQRLGVGPIGDVRRPVQHAEHGLDIDGGLLDLAIDHAHEVQRLVELDHHGVDHDKIADGVGALLDAVGAHHHGGGEPEREDDGLAGIEHRKRGVGLYARVLVALHGAVVAPRLARFGDEVLHRFIVEQRVDRLGVGVGVAVVHAAPDADTPFGRDVGEPHVERDGCDDHQHVTPVELIEQHANDQQRPR